MVKFYIWMTLKGVDLLCVSHVLPSDVSGDGTGYGSSDDDSRSVKLSKKALAQATTLAATLGAVMKATGFGAAGGSSGNLKTAALDEAEVNVKEKEAEALVEQAKATKAGAIKELAECKEAPKEMRDRAFSKWAEVLGI
jgi:hypothetical protein